eukprot:754241-Hanusia_phi.AAC.5
MTLAPRPGPRRAVTWPVRSDPAGPAAPPPAAAGPMNFTRRIGLVPKIEHAVPTSGCSLYTEERRRREEEGGGKVAQRVGLGGDMGDREHWECERRQMAQEVEERGCGVKDWTRLKAGQDGSQSKMRVRWQDMSRVSRNPLSSRLGIGSRTNKREPGPDPGCMFAILAQFNTTILHYGDEKSKYSDAPGEDYLFNSEGNNTENKLKTLGVNVDSWGLTH